MGCARTAVLTTIVYTPQYRVAHTHTAGFALPLANRCQAARSRRIRRFEGPVKARSQVSERSLRCRCLRAANLEICSQLTRDTGHASAARSLKGY
eukprot:5426803-Prymnesium_polylepis.1